jgi:hypothetical protein
VSELLGNQLLIGKERNASIAPVGNDVDLLRRSLAHNPRQLGNRFAPAQAQNQFLFIDFPCDDRPTQKRLESAAKLRPSRQQRLWNANYRSSALMVVGIQVLRFRVLATGLPSRQSKQCRNPVECGCDGYLFRLTSRDFWFQRIEIDQIATDFLHAQATGIGLFKRQLSDKTQAIDQGEDILAIVGISGLKQAGADQIPSPNDRPF